MADGRLGVRENTGEESPDTVRQHALRKRGSSERKFRATESVTETKPPHGGVMSENDE